MIGDRVDVKASRAKLEKYSLENSKGYAGAVALVGEGNRAERGNTPPAGLGPPWLDVPDEVLQAAVVAMCFASDVIVALLPHLPEAVIKLIYDRLLAEWRADGVLDADFEYGPPGGLMSWADHRLFADPVNLDWQELRELAVQS